MVRIYVAVGLLALRLRVERRRSRRGYVGLHWAPGVLA